MEYRALHRHHHPVRNPIIPGLLHGGVSVFAVILAGFVILFGFCVLPFSTRFRHPRRPTDAQPHAIPPRTP
jgi:hypothetical protein